MIKKIGFALAVMLAAITVTVSAQETELNLSLGKTATMVNNSTETVSDVSVLLTPSGYNTENNTTAIEAKMTMGWGDKGYIDIDLEKKAIISRIEWKINHVFGALGVLDVYASNDPDFTQKVSLGAVTDGAGAFSDENYYRYIRLEKNANYDFYPGQISVYGYKSPVEVIGFMNETVNADSVVMLGFSEPLSVDTKLEDIKVLKNGTEIKIQATLDGSCIAITPQNCWEKGGIYKIVIPPETVVAEDTRKIGTEIAEYFAVNTDSIDVTEYSLANNILEMKLHNKTESDISLSVWSVDHTSLPYSITETTGIISAGGDYEAYISVSNEFAVYTFEDCGSMKQLLDCFTNTALSQPTDGTKNGVKYVDGVITVTGNSEREEVTAVLTDDDETVSAATAKSVLTAAVKNGKYTVSIVVDTELDSENRKVWVADGTGEQPAEYDVYVYNKNDMQSCADGMAQMSAEELKSFFESEENAKIITAVGIIDERPNAEVYEQISALSTEGAYTDIVRAINTELVLAIVKEKGFIYGVEKYNEYLEVDKTEKLCADVYENGICEEAEAFMDTDYSTVDEFKAELAKAFKLAIFTNALSVEAAMDFAKENNDFFELDFDGDYDDLSAVNKKNVITAAMKGASLESIQTNFDEAVKKYKKAAERKPSGGGGGGGGGSSVAATTKVIPQNLPEVQIGELTEEPDVQKETEEKPVIVFSDLHVTHWAYESVTALAQLGIINGDDGKFKPDDNVTREEFVKMLVVAAEVENGGENTFEDVPDDAWYCGYVTSARNSGIVSGISETQFGTGMNITRQDIAVMLYNVLKKESVALGTGEAAFSDGNDISDYAKEAVNLLAADGIIKGRDNNEFKPLEHATRAEAAELIYRLFEKLT